MLESVNQSIELKAAIHIGASSVSMLITSGESMEEVDFLEQATPLAHDIFSKGKVSKATIERIVKIIDGYIANLSEYGEQDPANLTIAASNILFEASNKENFLTRLQIACNHPVSVLDDGEMTRLLYLKTRRRLKDTPVMQKRKTLLLHVGPGNTRAILLNHGRIISYKSYRLGTHRTAEALDIFHEKGKRLLQLIHDHSGGQISALINDYKESGIEEIVLIGYEIQKLSHGFLTKSTDKVGIKSLKNLSNSLSKSTIDEIVRHHPVGYQAAEAALPAVEINIAIAEALGVESLRMSGSDFERGLLIDISTQQQLSVSFGEEVLRSAEELAQKFKVHSGHAAQVSKLCDTLFTQLQDIHQLEPHDLLLLKAAATLHEVGGYISNKAHHKHSMYLIMHSEIFGLSQRDVNLIALISRYHRNSPPKPSHSVYRDLDSRDQVRVSKLSAILRVADALDRTHSGRIGEIEILVKKRSLQVFLHGVQEASVERLAMKSKGDLMEDIFGLGISIIESPTVL